MKKMFFCIIPLVAVLMGCASSGTAIAETNSNAGGTGTEDGGVEQLAADLGKAVNGGTVTLSGWAGLKTALTVPEGVTLDLTGDGAALELQDGAVLTVNGTVNTTGHGDHGKGWIEGSLRMGDGAAVIAGKGNINLKSKGRLLNIGSDKGKRQLTLDGVTLVGLPNNDSPLVGVHNGGEFILKSGAITGNTYNSNDGANGGGVDVGRGTFTMEGGAISGNTATSNTYAGGGGVKVSGSATFIMAGGTIFGNTTIAGENYTGNGGGVSLSGSTFIMRGGVISGNTATSRSNRGEGGGVQVNESMFIMEGGTIYGRADRLPTGTDASLANSAPNRASSLRVWQGTANWGTGGTYTKGGVSQTGGEYIIYSDDVAATEETLIATP
jgi:hypothetical protein